jgi:uncharacterized protein YceK
MKKVILIIVIIGMIVMVSSCGSVQQTTVHTNCPSFY